MKLNRYAYLNYLLKKHIRDIILICYQEPGRGGGGDFGRTCSAEIQVYGVVSRGINGKVIVIF